MSFPVVLVDASVTPLSRVDDEYVAARPPQLKGGRQSGVTASDDGEINLHGVVRRGSAVPKQFILRMQYH